MKLTENVERFLCVESNLIHAKIAEEMCPGITKEWEEEREKLLLLPDVEKYLNERNEVMALAVAKRKIASESLENSNWEYYQCIKSFQQYAPEFITWTSIEEIKREIFSLEQLPEIKEKISQARKKISENITKRIAESKTDEYAVLSRAIEEGHACEESFMRQPILSKVQSLGDELGYNDYGENNCYHR